MKLAQIRVKVFSEATAVALEAAINAFVATQGEAVFISIQFSADGAVFSAHIVYAV